MWSCNQFEICVRFVCLYFYITNRKKFMTIIYFPTFSINVRLLLVRSYSAREQHSFKSEIKENQESDILLCLAFTWRIIISFLENVLSQNEQSNLMSLFARTYSMISSIFVIIYICDIFQSICYAMYRRV